ncbi:hypothetical protein [Brevibacterium litoralis]|uniref:hypothetical protein n=1 Tax=Brevibacterium litoralis TaxID=3138935 RepID=UPI0032EE6CC7
MTARKSDSKGSPFPEGVDLDQDFTVLDAEGIPDHILNPAEVMNDGWTLALRMGAAHGDQDTTRDALVEYIDKWRPHEGYVLTSALTHLACDLVPMVAGLARAATGVDFPKHCQAMLDKGDDYDPSTVDGGEGR